MFTYRGSKKRVAKMYPEPSYPLIIEPFCGSAAYSVLHSNRQVWINDKSKVVHDIWKWLIHDAEIDDLWPHRNLPLGTVFNQLGVRKEIQDLLGFVYGPVSSKPANHVTRFIKSGHSGSTDSYYQIKRICEMLYSIRHWHITNDDYRDLPNTEATWFIDPPYKQTMVYGDLEITDYESLAKWCKCRRGEVIVCEKYGADWLPFKPLTHHFGRTKRQIEVMWYKKD